MLIIRNELNSEPVYNKIFLKTKTKSYGDKITDFYDKEIPNADCNHTFLAVISLDSAFNKDGTYYSQVFLKECKYIKKKLIRHIVDNLERSSDDSDDSDDSDEE